MTLDRVTAGTGLALAASLLLTPALAPQDVDMSMEGMDDETTGFDLDARAGLTIPGDVLDNTVGPGAAFGAGLGYWLNDHVALRADGGLGLLPGDEIAGSTDMTDLRLWHYNAGIQLGLGRDDARPWRVTAKALLGGTTLETEDAVRLDGEFDDTYLSTNLGVKAGYEITERVSLGVGGRAYGLFASDEDTERLRELDGVITPFDDAWTFPVTAEVEIRLD